MSAVDTHWYCLFWALCLWIQMSLSSGKNMQFYWKWPTWAHKPVISSWIGMLYQLSKISPMGAFCLSLKEILFPSGHYSVRIKVIAHLDTLPFEDSPFKGLKEKNPWRYHFHLKFNMLGVKTSLLFQLLELTNLLLCLS